MRHVSQVFAIGLATAALAASAQVDSTTAPATLIERIARSCMQSGSVIEMTQTQVKCERTLDEGQKLVATLDAFGNVLLTQEVRQFATYTVIPNGRGSTAQVREWVEAQIGLRTRSADLDVTRKSGAYATLQMIAR